MGAKLDVKRATVRAVDQDEVFALVAAAIDADPARIIAALRHREASASTGVGDGVALPHACIKGLDHPVLVDLTLEQPVSWDDGAEPVTRCLCALTPDDEVDPREAHHALMAEAARRVEDDK
ncbi:MAG: PTS system nitrogen regulatory IIA component [Myxococcota bacterium]|jgi:PTS system nitrogen regulatory IIA component